MVLFGFDLGVFAIILIAMVALLLASVLYKSGFMRKAERDVGVTHDDGGSPS